MSGDEINADSIKHKGSEDSAIIVKDASFAWTKGEVQTLTNISMTVPKKSLLAVVGQVGSGKSSFLQALLGDMFKVKGDINIDGTVAYVPQQAWILNSTLRQNIIYTNTLDEKKLKGVIKNCALEEDLKVLPAGDNTEIGEKGINLSGYLSIIKNMNRIPENFLQKCSQTLYLTP